jgi:heptosyltransferase-2
MPNWLGDAVMALPALRYIRESLPRAGLHLAARPGLFDLLGTQPGVDGVIVSPPSAKPALIRCLVGGRRALPEEWAGIAPALGVLFPNSLQSAVWLWRLGARRRVGYALDCRRLFLTDPLVRDGRVEMLHFTRYYLEVAQKAVGIAAAFSDFAPPPILDRSFLLPRLGAPESGVEEARRLYAEGGGEGGYAVLAPMSAYGPVKDWPKEHYRQLAKALIDIFGLTPVVTGSAGQRDGCAAVLAGLPGGVNLAGRTSLPGFVGLIAGSRLFVGGDSGGAHVAAALCVPTLVIFGVTNPARTKALGPRVRMLGRGEAGAPDLSQAGIRARAEKALRDIAPAEAVAAIGDLLRD